MGLAEPEASGEWAWQKVGPGGNGPGRTGLAGGLELATTGPRPAGNGRTSTRVRWRTLLTQHAPPPYTAHRSSRMPSIDKPPRCDDDLPSNT